MRIDMTRSVVGGVCAALVVSLAADPVSAEQCLGARAGGVGENAPLTLQSPKVEPFGHHGSSVASVPDVDGDGLSDVLVGAPDESVELGEAGRVHLFSGASGDVLRTFGGFEYGGMFGTSVAGLPDVDGDAHGDVAVGAMWAGPGGKRDGRVYVFSGAAGTLLRTLRSPDPNGLGGWSAISGQFGRSLAVVPDSGGGQPNLVVGAPLERPGKAFAGRVYVFELGKGLPVQALESPQPDFPGVFGESLSAVPDADGDGQDDILVGAPGEEVASAAAGGRAFLFSGATGTLLRELESPSVEPLGFFGDAVAGVPDADGDGRGDLLVGAPSEGIRGAGLAYLFSGASGTLLRDVGSSEPDRFGHFGSAVAGLSDVDGDGQGDLLVGAPNETLCGRGSAGRAYLYSGGTGALLAALQNPEPQRESDFGSSVAAVPDADGDGLVDVLVGAVRENVGDSEDAGAAYLYFSPTSTEQPASPRRAREASTVRA